MPAWRICTLSGAFLLFWSRCRCLFSSSLSESWTDLRRFAASARRSRDALTAARSVSARLIVSRRLPAFFSSAMRLKSSA